MQHNDSYLYGSNNPVNRFDPDGGADYPSVSMKDYWFFVGREAKSYKDAAPGAVVKGGALFAGVVVIAAAPELTPAVVRAGPIVGKAISAATLIASNFVLSNPEAVAATAELGKDIVGAIDPSSPPDNPREMFFNILFDKISDWLNKD